MERRRDGSQEKLIKSAEEEAKMIGEILEVKNRGLNMMRAKEKKDAHKRSLKELKKPWR